MAVDIPRRRLGRRDGVVRFANASDKVVTFYLMPHIFETRNARAGGVGIAGYVRGWASTNRERAPVPATTCPQTVTLHKDEWGDRDISTGVGSSLTVAVTTLTQSNWWFGRQTLSIWDCVSVRHRRALVVLPGRFEDPAAPNFGAHAVKSDENIARIVHEAIPR